MWFKDSLQLCRILFPLEFLIEQSNLPRGHMWPIKESVSHLSAQWEGQSKSLQPLSGVQHDHWLPLLQPAMSSLCWVHSTTSEKMERKGSNTKIQIASFQIGSVESVLRIPTQRPLQTKPRIRSHNSPTEGFRRMVEDKLKDPSTFAITALVPRRTGTFLSFHRLMGNEIHV